MMEEVEVMLRDLERAVRDMQAQKRKSG